MGENQSNTMTPEQRGFYLSQLVARVAPMLPLLEDPDPTERAIALAGGLAATPNRANPAGQFIYGPADYLGIDLGGQGANSGYDAAAMQKIANDAQKARVEQYARQQMLMQGVQQGLVTWEDYRGVAIGDDVGPKPKPLTWDAAL
jgi:hypothetical protein